MCKMSLLVWDAYEHLLLAVGSSGGFFLACEDFVEGATIHSLPALFICTFYFFKVEISMHTSNPLF